MNRIPVHFSIMVTTVALVAMLAGVWLLDIDREFDSRATLLPDQVMTLFSDPKPLTAFALTDDRNRVFDLESLQGKWSFLFFGFSHCPDVCPTTLAVLARARENIAKGTVGAENVQFVFVSVDPNRDTTSKLRQYVDHFDTSFVGVTGDNAQIASLAGQLGATYRVAITPGVENYPVYHSTAVFLVDPRARYHAVFTPPLDAEAISRRFKVVRELEGGGAGKAAGVSVRDAWIREAPPGATMMAGYLELRNSNHLMLTNPKPALRAGDAVVIKLEFRGGLVLPVAFAVRR